MTLHLSVITSLFAVVCRAKFTMWSPVKRDKLGLCVTAVTMVTIVTMNTMVTIVTMWLLWLPLLPWFLSLLWLPLLL